MTSICDLDALTPVERERSVTTRRLLVAATTARDELPDGYRFRLRADVALAVLGEWIALERRCCPLFAFEVAVAPANGPVTLTITGPPDVKEILGS